MSRPKRRIVHGSSSRTSRRSACCLAARNSRTPPSRRSGRSAPIDAREQEPRELVAVGRLGELRRAAGVDRTKLGAVPRAGREDGGVAAVRGPLDVAAQIGDDGVGAGVAQRSRLRVGADEGADGVPASEQESHDAAPEPPVGTGDEHDHRHILARLVPHAGVHRRTRPARGAE